MVDYDKKDWILLLKKKETKTKTQNYIKKNLHSFIEKYSINDLYDILINIEKEDLRIEVLNTVINKKEDYYLLLKRNYKEKELDKQIEICTLNIIWENYKRLKSGKGKQVENKILYGLTENQIKNRIPSILTIGDSQIWSRTFDELLTYPSIYSYLKRYAFIVLEKGIFRGKIFEFLKKMKANGYENIIEENEDYIIAGLIEVDLKKLKEEKLLLPIKALIKELLEKTNTKMEDIKYKGKGTYSAFFQIGNLGIKSGSKINKKIPYHPRFLRPLLRKEILENTYIEVYKYVKPIENLPEEEVYKIYKELREDGIVWIDPRAENIGMLLEDNDTTINGEKIDIKDEVVGFIGNNNHITYLKGNLVILDVDTATYEEDLNLEYYENRNIDLHYYKEMERKYQKEKKHTSIKN